MWQFMHWALGIERVNWCSTGCPRSRFEMVGSFEKLSPWLPYLHHQLELLGERSLA